MIEETTCFLFDFNSTIINGSKFDILYNLEPKKKYLRQRKMM